MRRFFFGAIGLAAALAIGACGKNAIKNELSTQNPLNRAASDIRDSFLLPGAGTGPGSGSAAGGADAGTGDSPGAPLSVDQNRITIAKAALDKEFLLQANLVAQAENPSFSGQKSRVVFFRRAGAKLILIEASKGLLAAKDYPQTLPLAEFPIVSETGGEIGFDFSAGMSRLFASAEMRARDLGSADPAVAYVSIKAALSYIERASFIDNHTLEIRQFAQLEKPASDGTAENVPIEVVYYLSPYAPSADFVPARAPRNMDRMGFFEVWPQFNGDGGTVAFAMKQNTQKPIQYAISSNTPKEYEDAVREGALYWNKALGRDAVTVVMAPAGVFAPNPLYNIIQWVDYPVAMAYADMQADPRTGEILHQQIYLPNGMAKLARRIAASSSRRPGAKSQLALAGFGSASLCDLDLSEALSAGFSSELPVEKDQAQLVKLSSDLIRWVVAHEVGHTLGLRHNFAGSLAANYAADEVDGLYDTYRRSGSTRDGLVISSSVMDYPSPLEWSMFGDIVGKAPQAMEYDEKAMATLYFGKRFASSSLPLFCTDSQLGKYLDCERWDSGNSYLAWVKYSGRGTLGHLPRILLQKYVEAKYPADGSEPIDPGDLPLDNKTVSKQLFAPAARFLGLLSPKGRILSVERQFAVVGAANDREARAKTIDFIVAELARNGGFEQIFPKGSDAKPEGLQQEFADLLGDPGNLRGETVAGKAYEFSGQDVAEMKRSAAQFFASLPRKLAKAEAQALAGASVDDGDGDDDSAPQPVAKFDDTALTAAFARFLADRAHELIFATAAGEAMAIHHQTTSVWTEGPTGTNSAPAGQATTVDSTFALPRFAYPFETREIAAGLLKAERSEQPGFGYSERARLAKELKAIVLAAFPSGVDEIMEDSSVPDRLKTWIFENAKVAEALGREAKAKSP